MREKEIKEVKQSKRLKRKCPICGEMGYADEMEVVKDTEKSKEKYIHRLNCLDKYIEQREFKKIETKQWEELYEYVRNLHCLVSDEGKLPLPKAIVVRLQGLRNGQDIRGGEIVKTFKMGATYDLILEAYKLAESSILWCIEHKLNQSNDVRAMNYCMSIMTDKLNDAWMNRKMKKENEEKEKQILHRNARVNYDYSLDFEDSYSSRKRKTDDE